VRRIETKTTAHIEVSQGRSFNGQGMHKGKVLASWQNWRPSTAESETQYGRHEVMSPADQPSGLGVITDQRWSAISNQRCQEEELNVKLPASE